MSGLLFSVFVLYVLVASTATAPLPDSGKNDMCWYIQCSCAIILPFSLYYVSRDDPGVEWTEMR